MSEAGQIIVAILVTIVVAPLILAIITGYDPR